MKKKMQHVFPRSILKNSILQPSSALCFIRSIISMSTFPSTLKPFPKLYDIAGTIIQDTNRSLLNPLLDLISLYFLSWASFNFLRIHGELPYVLCSNTSFISEQSTYYFCTSNNLQIPYAPLMRSIFNHLIACNMICNTLPESARGCNSFGIFKKYLREFFCQ